MAQQLPSKDSTKISQKDNNSNSCDVRGVICSPKEGMHAAEFFASGLLEGDGH